MARPVSTFPKGVVKFKKRKNHFQEVTLLKYIRLIDIDNIYFRKINFKSLKFLRVLLVLDMDL